jgi:hypothetical protein
VRRKDVASLAIGLIVGGLTSVLFLATGSERPAWAWVLAWGAMGLGAILILAVSVSEPLRRWQTRRRQRGKRTRPPEQATCLPRRVRSFTTRAGGG